MEDVRYLCLLLSFMRKDVIVEMKMVILLHLVDAILMFVRVREVSVAYGFIV